MTSGNQSQQVVNSDADRINARKPVEDSPVGATA
jgi:hypothetical protein